MWRLEDRALALWGDVALKDGLTALSPLIASESAAPQALPALATRTHFPSMRNELELVRALEMKGNTALPPEPSKLSIIHIRSLQSLFSTSIPAQIHSSEGARFISCSRQREHPNKGAGIGNERSWQGGTPLTSAISKAPIIAHRAEVLKNEDSHRRDDKQHHKHHHPYISTERLWRGRENHGGRPDTPPHPTRTRFALRSTPVRVWDKLGWGKTEVSTKPSTRV